jgi:hypothetical protein
MLTKTAPQFLKVLYKWTPQDWQEAKLLHDLNNPTEKKVTPHIYPKQ